MNSKREIVRHFSYDELVCRCGNPACIGLPPLHPHNMEFLKKISVLRDMAGKLIVTSFYRCPLHDLYREESAHSACLAIDLRPVEISLVELYVIASGHWGFTGMGINEERNFIHLDSKGRLARWKYKNGKPEFLFYGRQT